MAAAFYELWYGTVGAKRLYEYIVFGYGRCDYKQ
jgi:hypothetical protein